MRRRTYLATVMVGAGLTGGCLTGDGGTGSPTSNETGTDSPTATPNLTDTPGGSGEPMESERERETETETRTSEADPLSIVQTNLIWGSEGDGPVVNNEIAQAGAGSKLVFGARYRAAVEPDEFAPEMEVRLFDDGGQQIDLESHGFESEIEEAQTVDAPFWLTVDARGYSTGTYTAAVTMTDEVSGETSETVEFSFDLVDPLDPADVELLEYEPRSVPVDEAFEMELTVRNTADRTSSITNRMVAHLGDDDAHRALSRVPFHIPAQSTVTHRLSGYRLPDPGPTEFEFRDTDISWAIDGTQ